MRISLLAAISLLLAACTQVNQRTLYGTGHDDSNTANAIDALNPASGSYGSSSYPSQLYNSLAKEDANRWLEQSFANQVSTLVNANACLGGTGAGLTMTPTSCVAYNAGYRGTETGSITFPNNSTCWVAMDENTSGSNPGLSNFTRVGSTHYLIDCINANQPTMAVDSQLLMKVTTSGGAITVVGDYRHRGIGFTAAGTINGVSQLENTYYADGYPGADDCIKTNAAISDAITRGGGTVYSPGYPNLVASCTTPISITHGTSLAPIHLIVRETLKWTTSAPANAFLVDSNTTSAPPGGPSDTIDCEVSPLTYSVTDGTEPAAGFDFEPSSGSNTPIISLGLGSSHSIVGVTVQRCGFMGNANAGSAIYCNGINCVSSNFIGNGYWALSSGSKPTGSTVTAVSISMAAYNRDIISANFAQDVTGGVLNLNFGGSGGGGDLLQNNFASGSTGPCGIINGTFGLTFTGNGCFSAILSSNQGAWQFSNDTSFHISGLHVDSVSPASMATGTAQVLCSNCISGTFDASTLDGNSGTSNKTLWPQNGIVFDAASFGNSYTGVQCAQTNGPCVNNSGQLYWHDPGNSNAADFTSTTGMYTVTPQVRGATVIADYEQSDYGTGYGALYENSGWGVFDGISTYVVDPANRAFTTGSESFAIAFRTSTTAGGTLAFLSPSLDPTIHVGLAQGGLFMTTNGHLSLRYNGCAQQINPATNYADGAWHLAFATLDSSVGAVLYVDGASVGTNANVPTYSVNPIHWIVGGGDANAICGIGGLSKYWKANIDLFAWWPSTVSSVSIAAISQTVPESSVPTGAGTIAALTPTFYWNFDADPQSLSTMGIGQFGQLQIAGVPIVPEVSLSSTAVFGNDTNFPTNTVLTSYQAANAGHFTQLTCTMLTLAGGSCTTAPILNIFDGTSNTGTAKTCLNSVQTKGNANKQAETLTYAAGDVVGIYVSTQGATCVAPVLNATATLTSGP